MQKILSVAHFVFIDLLKDVHPEELGGTSIDRCEYFVFFVCLAAFLFEFCDPDVEIYKVRIFLEKYQNFLFSNALVGRCNLKTVSPNIDPAQISIDKSNIEKDVLRYLYHQGIDKRKLFKPGLGDLNELSERSNTKSDQSDSKATNKDSTISLELKQLKFSKKNLQTFLRRFLAYDNSSIRDVRSICSNPSELAFIYRDLIMIPHASPDSLLCRLLLSLEQFVINTVRTCRSGMLTSKLGHRFERYVEEILEDSGFTILRSKESDPDVLAVHEETLFMIECKSRIEDIEYIFGVTYIQEFFRRSKNLLKAKRQARGWAKKIPPDISLTKTKISRIQPVVVVPHPAYDYPYLERKLKFELSQVMVLTPEDLVWIAIHETS